MDIKMLPNRPYLLRAFYQWIVDSHCTPYIVLDAENKLVRVPEQFIENGKIVLNVSPQATRDFEVTAHQLGFRARFSGVTRDITAPVASVLAIYAVENGRGIVFDEEDFSSSGDGEVLPPPDNSPPDNSTPAKGKKRPPHLRVVK